MWRSEINGGWKNYLLSVGSALAGILFALLQSWQASCSLTVRLSRLGPGCKRGCGWLNLSFGQETTCDVSSHNYLYLITSLLCFLQIQLCFYPRKTVFTWHVLLFKKLALYLWLNNVDILINNEQKIQKIYFWKCWRLCMTWYLNIYSWVFL